MGKKYNFDRIDAGRGVVSWCAIHDRRCFNCKYYTICGVHEDFDVWMKGKESRVKFFTSIEPLAKICNKFEINCPDADIECFECTFAEG